MLHAREMTDTRRKTTKKKIPKKEKMQATISTRLYRASFYQLVYVYFYVFFLRYVFGQELVILKRG